MKASAWILILRKANLLNHDATKCFAHLESFSWILFTTEVTVTFKMYNHLRKGCHAEQLDKHVWGQLFCMMYVIKKY